MVKVFGFIIFVLIASIIIFYLFFSYSGKSYFGKIDFVKNEHRNKSLSMQQIDSLTASLNYHFTIKNRIIHRVSPDTVKIPVKQQRSSG